jgi:hypothetical protein
MTFVRLMGMLAIGWMVIALGAGVLGVGAPEPAGRTFYLRAPSLQDAIQAGPTNLNPLGEYRLLDRTTGQTSSLALPKDEKWSLLSVAPWRDRDGNLQAAGRWVSRTEGDEWFMGLGLVTLTGSTHVTRVPLDVLPTGKPCWVPDRPGEVLFPAGDGQLYRCSLAGNSSEKLSPEGSSGSDRVPAKFPTPHAVRWLGQPPGGGVAALSDPVWSAEPGLKHLVIVALGMQTTSGARRTILPFKVWWLVMSDVGDAIVDAGRLTRPGSAGSRDEDVSERMPSVVVGRNGKMSLVYFARRPDEGGWTLRSVELELDRATSLPRTRQSQNESSVLAGDLGLSSLVVSADGESVYTFEEFAGPTRHSIPK